MNNVMINILLENITESKLNDYIDTEELRTLKGKKLKSLEETSLFYISIRLFNKLSNSKLQSGILTILLHSAIPESCIVRLTKNVSYILLYKEDNKFRIALQSDLKPEELELYKERLK